MALADQAAAQAKNWRFVTTTGGVRAITVPDSQGEGTIEYFGVDIIDALSKCSGWDDYRSKISKPTTGRR